MTYEFLIFLKGFCSGFFYTFLSISGMVLVANYIIKKNWLTGMIAALGIVAVQLIWSLIAILILHLFYHNLDPANDTFSLIGSIILFLMGLKIYRSREKSHHEKPLKKCKLAIFWAGFLLTLVFPTRILGYFSIFAVINIHGEGPILLKIFLPVIGVFFGTFSFWLTFGSTIYHSKQPLSSKALQNLHKASALILIAFSIIGLLKIYL